MRRFTTHTPDTDRTVFECDYPDQPRGVKSDAEGHLLELVSQMDPTGSRCYADPDAEIVVLDYGAFFEFVGRLAAAVEHGTLKPFGLEPYRLPLPPWPPEGTKR